MNDDSHDRLSLSVPGTVDYLDAIRAFVEKHARDAGFSDDDVDAVVLSLDEAVANIVEHAYEDSPLPVKEQILQLIVEKTEKRFQITITDKGVPFDPTRAPDVDLDAHLAEFKQDGLGIHFIRELMDEMHYSYKKGEGNILEIVKYL